MLFGSYLVHRRTVGSAHFFWQIVGSVLSVPGDMGDQEIAYDHADWSEDSNMEECDPGAPLTDQASSDRNPDYTHADFAYKLKVQILPNDQENRGEFDVGVDFRIGDPNVHFRAAAAKSYETMEDVGKPDWHLLFGYIIAKMSHLQFLSTVYVLVDNRDLTNLDNPDPSLQHWPAVAAWWSSRASMQGPAGELCDVVFFRCEPSQWSSPGPPYMGRHLRSGSPLPGLSWSAHCAP